MQENGGRGVKDAIEDEEEGKIRQRNTKRRRKR